MSDPGRNRVVYVTEDGTRWLAVDFPSGLIPPPAFELHEPLAGPVQFLFAECYGLPIPAAAGAAAQR